MRDIDPLKVRYTKLRTTHHTMLLRILGAWCKSPNKSILSYKDALQRIECESIGTTVRTRRLLTVVVGGASPHGGPQVTQKGHVERAGECEKTWAGGEGEIMD